LLENRHFRRNGVSLARSFRYKGSSPTNHSTCQKTRRIGLSSSSSTNFITTQVLKQNFRAAFMWCKNVGVCFFYVICNTKHNNVNHMLWHVLWHCWFGHLTRNLSPIWPIMCLVGRGTLCYLSVYSIFVL